MVVFVFDVIVLAVNAVVDDDGRRVGTAHMTSHTRSDRCGCVCGRGGG